MKKKLFALTMATVSLFGADNQIRNPECDGDKWQTEFRTAEMKNQIELTQFVEDSTWNRCLKLTLKDYFIGKDGFKHVNAGVMLGGDAKKPGFPCKPDTVYEFKFELKGTAERAMVNFYQWDSKGKIKKQRTSIHLIRPQKDWTVYKGKFRTTANAKRAALYIQFWGDEKRRDLREKPGQFILIDKISVQEVEEFTPGAAQKTEGNIQLTPAPVFIAGSSPETAARIPGFKDLMEDKPARLKTNAAIYRSADALHVRIDSFGPITSDKYKGTGGGEIWKDDLAEMLLPALNSARQRALSISCLGNLKQIGQAEFTYALDSQDQYHGWVMKIITLKELNVTSDFGWSVFLWHCGYLPKPGSPKSIFYCAGQSKIPDNEYSTDSNKDIAALYKNNNYACNAVFMPTYAGGVKSSNTVVTCIKTASIKSPGKKFLFTDGLQRYNGSTIQPGIASQSFDAAKFSLSSEWGRFTYPHSGGINISFVDGHAGWLPSSQVIGKSNQAKANTVL